MALTKKSPPWDFSGLAGLSPASPDLYPEEDMQTFISDWLNSEPRVKRAAAFWLNEGTVAIIVVWQQVH